jgi:hypothetical protein
MRVLASVVVMAGVLMTQWRSVWPSLPRAPLHDCAGHQCGCPAEMTASRACCCFPASDNSLLNLRSAHCDSGSPAFAAVQKLYWAILAPEPLNLPVGLVARFEPVVVALSARPARPPVPPPKFLPAV